jgi:hypothetical protein
VKCLLATLILVTVVGCESDVDKLQRLERTRTYAAAGVLRGKEVTDSLNAVIAQLKPDKFSSDRARYDSATARLDTVKEYYARARIAYKRASDGIEKLVGHE